jgi:hypothetical protein
VRDAAELDEKTLMIFLVPTNGGSMYPSCQAEFDQLHPAEGDFKVAVSWQDTKSMPSISQVLTRVLKFEQDGISDPLPDYARHTLKALRRFIQDGFAGYDFERPPQISGMHPRLSIPDLLRQPDGFVGVQHGIVGLLGFMKADDLESRTFQFTITPKTNPNWIPLSRFQSLIQWYSAKRATRKPLDVDLILGAPSERQPLHSSIIYWLSTQDVSPFCVGIQRGAKGLQQLFFAEIDQKTWQIAGPELGSKSQWLPAARFRELYEEARRKSP